MTAPMYVAKFVSRDAAWAFMYYCDAQGWSPGYPSYSGSLYHVAYYKLPSDEVASQQEKSNG